MLLYGTVQYGIICTFLCYKYVHTSTSDVLYRYVRTVFQFRITEYLKEHVMKAGTIVRNYVVPYTSEC